MKGTEAMHKDISYITYISYSILKGPRRPSPQLNIDLGSIWDQCGVNVGSNWGRFGSLKEGFQRGLRGVISCVSCIRCVSCKGCVSCISCVTHLADAHHADDVV